MIAEIILYNSLVLKNTMAIRGLLGQPRENESVKCVIDSFEDFVLVMWPKKKLQFQQFFSSYAKEPGLIS